MKNGFCLKVVAILLATFCNYSFSAPTTVAVYSGNASSCPTSGALASATKFSSMTDAINYLYPVPVPASGWEDGHIIALCAGTFDFTSIPMGLSMSVTITGEYSSQKPVILNPGYFFTIDRRTPGDFNPNAMLKIRSLEIDGQGNAIRTGGVYGTSLEIENCVFKNFQAPLVQLSYSHSSLTVKNSLFENSSEVTNTLFTLGNVTTAVFSGNIYKNIHSRILSINSGSDIRITDEYIDGVSEISSSLYYIGAITNNTVLSRNTIKNVTASGANSLFWIQATSMSMDHLSLENISGITGFAIAAASPYYVIVNVMSATNIHAWGLLETNRSEPYLNNFTIRNSSFQGWIIGTYIPDDIVNIEVINTTAAAVFWLTGAGGTLANWSIIGPSFPSALLDISSVNINDLILDNMAIGAMPRLVTAHSGSVINGLKLRYSVMPSSVVVPTNFGAQNVKFEQPNLNSDGLPISPFNTINAGNPLTDIAVFPHGLDIDGNFRIRDNRIDAGAVEGDGSQVANRAPVCGDIQVVGQGEYSVTSFATLSIRASDDGIPYTPGQLSYTWTKQGSNTDNFSLTQNSSSSASATVDPSRPGVYSVRVEVSDGQASCVKDVSVSFASLTNKPPTCAISGNTDLMYSSNSSGTAFVLAQDDGNYVDPLIITCGKKGTNQSDFSISSLSANTYSILPTKAGNYTIQCNVDDGGNQPCVTSQTFSFCAAGNPHAIFQPSDDPRDQCSDGVAGKESVTLNNPFIPGECGGSGVSSVTWTIKTNNGTPSSVTPSSTSNGSQFTFPSLTVGNHYTITYSGKDGAGKTATAIKEFSLKTCKEKDGFDRNDQSIIYQKYQNNWLLVKGPTVIDQYDDQGGLDQIEEIKVTANFDLNCLCVHPATKYKWSFRTAADAAKDIPFQYLGESSSPEILKTLTKYGDYQFEVEMVRNGAKSEKMEIFVKFMGPSPLVTLLSQGCSNSPKYCADYWNSYIGINGVSPDFSGNAVYVSGNGIQGTTLSGTRDAVIFAPQAIEGDFELLIKDVAPSSSSTSDGKGARGIMLRKSFNAASEMYFIGNNGGSNVALVRNMFNAMISSSSMASGTYYKMKRLGENLTLEVWSTSSSSAQSITIPNISGTWYLGLINANKEAREFSVVSSNFEELIQRPQEKIKSIFPDGNLISNFGFEQKSAVFSITGSPNINERNDVSPFEGLYSCKISSKASTDIISTKDLPIARTPQGSVKAILLSWMYKNENATSIQSELVFTGLNGTVINTLPLTGAMKSNQNNWSAYLQEVIAIPTGAAYISVHPIANDQTISSPVYIDNLVVAAVTDRIYSIPQTQITIGDGNNALLQTMRLDRSPGKNEEIVVAQDVDALGRTTKIYPSFVNSEASKIGSFKPDFVQKMSAYLNPSSSSNSGSYMYPRPNLDPAWPKYGEIEYIQGPENQKSRVYGMTKGKVVKMTIGPVQDRKECYPRPMECPNGTCSDNVSSSSTSSSSGIQCTDFIVTTETVGDLATDTYADGMGVVRKVVQRAAESSSGSSSSQQLVQEYQADILGKVWKSWSPERKVSTNRYDNAGNLLLSQTPDEGVVEVRYDIEGNARFLRDAQNKLENKFIVNVYDKWNRVRRVYLVSDDAVGTRWSDDSRLLNMAWPEVRPNSIDESVCELVVQNEYDERSILSMGVQEYLRGRLSSQTVFDSHGQVHRVFSYDQAGNISEANLKVLNQPWTKVSYNYNNGGLVRAKTVSLGNSTRTYLYEYDAQNRLSKVWMNGGALLHYDYWPDDKVRRVRLAGNTANSIQIHYDMDGRMDMQGHYVHNGESLENGDSYMEALTIDETDKIVAKKYRLGNESDSWRKFEYQYDLFNRLIESNYSKTGSEWDSPTDWKDFDESIRYGLDGQITQLGRGTNAASNRANYEYLTGTHILKRITGAIVSNGVDRSATDNYVYDARGRLLVDKGNKRIFQYNWQGLHKKVITCSGNPEYSTTIGWVCSSSQIESEFEYVYDANGIRVAKFKK